MDLDTVATVLVACVPSLSAIITIITGFVAMVKQFKKDKQAELEEITAKLQTELEKQGKTREDIALIKAKLTSIENYIAEMEDK